MKPDYIVDQDDKSLVAGYGWYLVTDNGNEYAYANVKKADGKPTTVKMHRLILGITDPKVRVDHVNGNGLDNRRENLRVATGQQNSRNMKKWRGKSQFKGVYWNVAKGRTPRWHAQIRVNGKRLSLGYHDNEEDAARAYDRAAIAHHGEFAQLNFPVNAERPHPEG